MNENEPKCEPRHRKRKGNQNTENDPVVKETSKSGVSDFAIDDKIQHFEQKLSRLEYKLSITSAEPFKLKCESICELIGSWKSAVLF